MAAPSPDTRAYYDEFAHAYEAHRRPNRPDGYHALIDDLEVDLVQRYGAGADVLECGVGTGLLSEGAAISLAMFPILFLVVIIQLLYIRRVEVR